VVKVVGKVVLWLHATARYEGHEDQTHFISLVPVLKHVHSLKWPVFPYTSSLIRADLPVSGNRLKKNVMYESP
jgi:hypothetical protein